MFDIGGAEFLLIGLAILLLFGPKKIPEIMHSIGKGIRYFRQAQEDLKTQIRDISAEVEKETNLTAVINSTPESEVKVHAELDATITESISIRPAEGAISIHAPKEEDSNEINQAG